MTGGSAAQAMELDSAGTEAPATQGGDDVLRDASRLRSWAEATLRADIGHGSGNEGMEGLASVRAAVPAWSGGEDVELWLATLCGGIEWCYWALDKGVLSVCISSLLSFCSLPICILQTSPDSILLTDAFTALVKLRAEQHVWTNTRWRSSRTAKQLTERPLTVQARLWHCVTPLPPSQPFSSCSPGRTPGRHLSLWAARKRALGQRCMYCSSWQRFTVRASRYGAPLSSPMDTIVFEWAEAVGCGLYN